MASYFGELGDNLATAASLPVAGLHLDLVRGFSVLDDLDAIPKQRWLSLGLVDGRNVRRTDLRLALRTLQRIAVARGSNLMVASSCSLLHVPVDLAREQKIDNDVKVLLHPRRDRLATSATTRLMRRQFYERAHA